MATVQEMLTEVETAISSLVTRKIQSVSINGTSYSYNNLKELRAWRNELKKELRSTSNMIRLADISGI